MAVNVCPCVSYVVCVFGPSSKAGASLNCIILCDEVRARRGAKAMQSLGRCW